MLESQVAGWIIKSVDFGFRMPTFKSLFGHFSTTVGPEQGALPHCDSHFSLVKKAGST